MDKLFESVTDSLNETILNLNQVLANIAKNETKLYDSILNYFNEVIELKYEPYELVYPYIGMKEEILYTVNVVNKLIELNNNFIYNDYYNQNFSNALEKVIIAEREFFKTYGMVYFDPFSWDSWLVFADEYLIDRGQLIYTLLLAINILQDEDPVEILDNFYNSELLDMDAKLEILDFMAYNHLEQTNIKDYFTQRIVVNVAHVLGNS